MTLAVWSRFNLRFANVRWLEKSDPKKYSYQMVVFHGDESHGMESVKKSPTKQTKVICPQCLLFSAGQKLGIWFVTNLLVVPSLKFLNKSEVDFPDFVSIEQGS